VTKLREITVTKRLQALAVDIIRRLWHLGKYRNNKWLRMIHDNWVGHWIDVKAAVTMRSVDKQAEALTPEPEVVQPVYWEIEEGETPLGGTIGYTYQFDDAPSSADPVQGPE
jgi:hypothetical protein